MAPTFKDTRNHRLCVSDSPRVRRSHEAPAHGNFLSFSNRHGSRPGLTLAAQAVSPGNTSLGSHSDQLATIPTWLSCILWRDNARRDSKIIR
jgi:hypothetical protein